MFGKIFRKLALIISFIALITSTVNTTYGLIITKSGTLVNTFVPTDSIVNSFVIKKTIEHPLGEGYVIPDSISFDFEVALGQYYSGAHISTTQGVKKADNDGKLRLSVKPDAPVSIEGIDKGTKVTVTEIQNTHKGFAVKDGEAEKEITIGNAVGTAGFINVYSPEGVYADNITVKGEKILEGRQWQKGDSFTFELLQKNGDSWTLIGSTEIKYDSSDKDFNRFDLTDVMKNVKFEKVGEYSFKLIEKKGNLDNMDYDKTENVFTVKVTDSDMDGSLEISNVTASQNAKAEKQGDTFEVNVIFNNTFKPPFITDDITEYITVDKAVENRGELSISPEGFKFILENTQTGEKQLVTTDEVGRASLPLVFTQQDIDRSYNYTLYEKNEGKAGVTYDSKIYKIDITVKKGADNKLVVETKVDSVLTEGVFAQFTNIYEMNKNEPPETRDDNNIYLWILLMIISAASCAVLLVTERKLRKN